MTFSERNKLAYQLGAVYENGYWCFPSAEVKNRFDRIVMGMEWAPGSREKADEVLARLRVA